MIKYGVPIEKEADHPYDASEMQLDIISNDIKRRFKQTPENIEVLQIPTNINRLLVIITLKHSIPLKKLEFIMEEYTYQLNKGYNKNEEIHFSLENYDIVSYNYRKA